MAFLKYRGSTTTPGVWASSLAASAPLTNDDIDKNFASLDAQKLDLTGGTITGALAIGQNLTAELKDGSVLFVDGTNTSKKLAFQLSGITASTTRTLTAPDVSGTIALTSDIFDAGLTLQIGPAGATNTSVTIGTGTGFTANDQTATTYDIKVGPALANLSTFMTTAGAGFIKRGATADTYTIDTSTYSLSSHGHYIGTTAVQATSANQAVTGITSITGGTGTTAISLLTSNVAGATGALSIATGNALATGDSGTVSIASGNGFGTGNSGTVTLASGSGGTSANGNSGAVTIKSGNATTQAGVLLLTTGNAASAGAINIYPGPSTLASADSAADVYIAGGATNGNNAVVNAGNVTIVGGANTGAAGLGGNVVINAGTGVTAKGSITIGGTGVTTTIAGDLIVNGTTSTINSTTISVDDKNIELGSVAAPTDTTADGGGITLKGTTDKTFNWVDATDAWTSSEHINIASAKAYYIAGTSVLNATTLGSGVTASSLTSVGTVTSGTWSGSFGAVSGANLTTLNASNLSSGTVPNARISGAYTGITSITGSAATLTTGRTISLTGDVTGTSGEFDGSGNLSFATTITANSVALGTDTTGNYMLNVAAGTGISVSHTQAEGSTATVSLLASDLTLFPTSNFKKSVRVATTANITLSAPQTIDGIAVVAGNRVLVKNQTLPAQNGIYIVAAAAWARSTAADGSTEIDSAVVGVDEGTASGGKFFTNVFKSTDVVGTTVMPWYEVLTSQGISTTVITAGTLPIARGGTNTTATPTNGAIAYGTGTAYAFSAAGTSGYILKSNGAAAPTWTINDLTSFPTSNYKKSVKAATTANLGEASATATTITGTLVVFPAQDGITLALGDRLLVKNQTTVARNGIYTLTTVGVAATTAWVLTRATAADGSTEIDSAVVGVDQGTANGGLFFTNTFKSTDTVGTTAMPWYKVVTDNEVGNGTLTVATKSAGLTNTDVTLSLSGAYSANSSTNRTINAVVGPALTNLAALMTTAGAGFIKRGATADTYGIDTSTYSLSSHGHFIGTTAVQSASANQAVTGITSIAGGSGNTNIVLNSADNDGSTGELRLKSGTVSGASGDSGAVEIESGTTNGTVTNGASSGLIRLTTGNSGTNGGAGGIILAAGITNGSAINSGTINIYGGNTASSNSVSSNGNIYIAAGSPTFATGNKYGGRVYIDGGRPAVGGTILDDGQVYIGTKSTVGGTGTVVIGIGHSTSTTTINGTVKLANLGTSGFVKLTTGGELTQDTTTYLSGTVAIASGGTNITAYAAGDILYASAANVLSKLAKGTDGQVLKLASGLPTWGADNNTGTVTSVGNGNGMNFTTFTTSGTVTLGTPSTLTASTLNAVQASSHTHAITGFATGTGTASGTNTGDQTTVTGNAGGIAAGLANQILYQSAPNVTAFIAAPSVTNSALTWNGSAFAWGAAGAVVTNDVTTNANTFFPVLSPNTSTGSLTAVSVSNTKLYYNPSTGQLNSTSFNSTSDVNLKENINTVEQALEKVDSLRGVTFNWKENGIPSIGVIAQEVESVLPEVVSTNETGEKSVNYSAIIGVLIEAIKELNEKIDRLHNQ